MADKREPKHVKALIEKHQPKPKPAEPAKQVIPAATLWHRLRLRKQK